MMCMNVGGGVFLEIVVEFLLQVIQTDLAVQGSFPLRSAGAAGHRLSAQCLLTQRLC